MPTGRIVCARVAPLASDQAPWGAIEREGNSLMAGETGDPPSVSMDQMDAMDRASMQNLQDKAPPATPCAADGSTAASEQQQAQYLSAQANVQDRADKKAELAQSMSAGTQMRVDPAEVDSLAKFFEGEAGALRNRLTDVQDLARVEAPGTDPVSTGAASAYGNVGAGDDRAYGENYRKLIDVFMKTADSLRASAGQTRRDDQDSADALKGKQ